MGNLSKIKFIKSIVVDRSRFSVLKSNGEKVVINFVFLIFLWDQQKENDIKINLQLILYVINCIISGLNVLRRNYFDLLIICLFGVNEYV